MKLLIFLFDSSSQSDEEKLLPQSTHYSAIALIHCFASFSDSQQTRD